VPALRVGTDTRPVRIVAATAPGSGPDILARLIGPWLSARLGQQFVVENRPGGGNNIGTEAVVRAPPDGYTLLIVSSSNTINATLYDKLNFVFLRDIAPVAIGIASRNVCIGEWPLTDALDRCVRVPRGGSPCLRL
jgi:tripartite-type tricarboxylate transporter receptor subunit TctC